MITISIIIVLLLAIVFSSNNKNFNSNNSVENNSQIVEGPKNIVTEYTGTLPSDTGLTVSGVSKKFNQDIISQVNIAYLLGCENITETTNFEDYINKNIFYLQLLGSIMLLLFGIYTFRSNPVQSIRPASSSKGSYFHNFITAFFVTLSNPLIIFLFIGLFARFAFVQPGVLVFEEITGYLAIAIGALTWWLGITYFVNKVRTKFNLRGIWILNRVVGSIVMLVSLAGLIFTLLGESLY